MSTPEEKTVAAGGVDALGRPARPAGYWERIDRLVAEAPPLTEGQKIRLRAIFQQAAERRKAA
ncbi:hypothetical protein HRW07_10055 [Streptomyces lunaelactis]|uniref:hypothetical protein n=1 Tax=Streptomyces lunaelactis TaxID=1535768 RepID=UPI001584B41C|nr:hypothetical protein [Streptomyces lunaelactis]NUL03571.1 hypothetical protein [Streptomyces lunaelactis]